MGFIREYLLIWNPELGEEEADATPYLYDNMGDTPQVRAAVRLEEILHVTTDDIEDSKDAIVINPSTVTSGESEDDRLLWTNNPEGFAGVKEGDDYTVQLNDLSHRTKAVLEKKSNQLLLMDSSYAGAPLDLILDIGRKGFVSTVIEDMEFFHNLIENDAAVNYNDLTTGITRRAVANGLSNNDLTDTQMKQLGSKAYQYGSLDVAGNGIGDGSNPPVVGVPDVSQAFIFKQKLLIAPLFTVDQATDDTNGIAPPYLKDSSSLKYVFRVEASRDLSNPNDVKTVIEFETLGNVGWENETPNTGTTDYFISNVVFKRSGGGVIDALELTTNEQTIEFDVENTVSSPFSNGGGTETRIIANIETLPTAQEQYRLPEFPTAPDTSNHPLKENFLFDKSVTSLDLGAVAGENFGGVDQVIKEVESTYVSGSKAHVVITVQMASAAVDKIAPLMPIKFKAWISTANRALARSKSDKVNLPIAKLNYFSETTDPTMITMTNGFYDHPMVEGDTVKESLILRPQDDFVSQTIFTLDRNDIPNFDRTDSEIDFLSATMQLIARKDSSTSFVLDEFTTSFNNLEIVNNPTYGTIPEIDVTQDRGFRAPVDDLRRNVRIKRRYDLDALTPAGIFNYEMTFPSIMRWEAWEPLPLANNDFLDPTAPDGEHKGKNHNWVHYFQSTGYTMYFKSELIATKDGAALPPYVLESQLVVEDFAEGSEWDTETINNFRTGNSDLIPNNGFMSTENTLIHGENTYIGLDANPLLSELVMVIYTNREGIDNWKNLSAISSKYPVDGVSSTLQGLGNDLTATKSNPSGNIFRVAAESNLKGEIPDRPAFRIYDNRADSGIPDGLATEDGILLETENGIPLYAE